MFIRYILFRLRIRFKDVSTKPSSLFLCKVMCVFLEFLFERLSAIFPLPIEYGFLIADAIHRLMLQRISLLHQSLDLF